MKKYITLGITIICILLSIANTVNADTINIYSDNDLSNINSGDEFKVKIKLNSNQDSVAVQFKLEFDENKFELIKNEYYEDLAKIEITDSISLATMDDEGNCVINTVKGQDDNNIIEVTFKAKEKVNLKKDKIILKTIDSNTEFEADEIVLQVSNQSRTTKLIPYIIGGAILIVILLVLVRLKSKNGDK